MESKIQERIPVYVLSGFLGSGKTTVLLEMLQECKRKGWQPGIILNEIGETNVEGHLFENEKVYELLNGCICCTIQDDLKETMDNLISEMKQQPMDILFIEGTGIANPLEIQEVLLAHPYVDTFTLSSIITVIDASYFHEYQSIFSSSAEIRNLIKEQIVCGSLLLLNKTDIVPSGKCRKLKQKINKIGGDNKKIVESTYGRVDPDILFARRIRSVLLEESTMQNIHHPHHHSDITAIKLENLPILSQRKFERWLKQLPDTVLRAKGFIYLEGSNSLYSFQYAAKNVEFAQVSETLIRDPLMILIGSSLKEEHIYQSYLKLSGV